MERARAYEQEAGIDLFFGNTEVVDQTVAFYHAIDLPEASIHYVDDPPAGHNVQT